MGIARYENFTVQNVTTTTDQYGQQVSSLTTAFQTRGLAQDVRNSLQIGKDDRVYQDLVKFIVNYTPNTQNMVENQSQYAIQWRGNEWRITDAIEANDRMSITFLCYRNDPGVAV